FRPLGHVGGDQTAASRLITRRRERILVLKGMAPFRRTSLQARRPGDVRTTIPSRPIGLAIADVLPDAQVFGVGAERATSCTSDADAVRPGDVFFAIDEADC